MQKKSENVAHAQDGIKLSKLKNSEPLVEFVTNTVNEDESYHELGQLNEEPFTEPK